MSNKSFERNLAEATARREASIKEFSYEFMPEGRCRDCGVLEPHYRIADSNDDRVATCYSESNAKLVVRLLNAGLKR